MASVLIQHGTIVNADSTVKADVLIDGATIKEIRAGIPAERGANGCRRDGTFVATGRHGCAHASRYAVRRYEFSRRFRNRDARGCNRRDDDDCRLCHPGARHEDAHRARHVVEEGRGQGVHRLRPAHDRHRSARCRPRRHGRHGARGRGQLQAVHGLSECADGGRCDDLQGAAPDREERRADVHARGEWLGDRRDRAAGAGGGQDRAHLSRADAAHARGGRGRASRHRYGGDGGRRRCISCTCRAKTR